MKNGDTQGIQLLIELRARLIAVLTVLLLVFAVLLYFANNLYTLLAQPLLRFLPEGHLIATQIVSPFFVPFKLAFMTSLFLCMPYCFYQLWAFTAPALYGHEKRLLWPFLLLSGVLFYAGVAFAYFVMLPMLFHFLAGVAPQGVVLSPDISEYLDFTTRLLLVFGALFEIPMVMTLLVSVGMVSSDRFRRMRSYAIVGAFIISMLLAPPDVLSQTMLALPIWALYEFGILLSKTVEKKNEKDELKIS